MKKWVIPCRAFTGAWVETLNPPRFRCTLDVAPSQARGLKLERMQPSGDKLRRRAFTGAWVETAA